MILRGQNSFLYWRQMEEGRHGERVYSWTNMFGLNPLALVIPYERKDPDLKRKPSFSGNTP
jgi:hypothetical protein